MTNISYTVALHKRFNHEKFGIYIGEDVPSGLYVVTIEPNSPAAYMDIQPGDRVLAINGQLVSSMPMNGKEMIEKIAYEAQSLTLSIQPSDILRAIRLLSTNDDYQYLLQQSDKDIGYDLENYIEVLFNEDLQITPTLSSNCNEYILSSNGYSYRLLRRRRKRRLPLKTVETQTSSIDEQKENFQPLSPYRAVPSMGTSHAILRNSQLNSKDNETNASPEIKPLPDLSAPINNLDERVNYIPEPISPPKQSFIYPPQFSDTRIVTHENFPPSFEATRKPPPVINDGLHEVRLNRSPNFPGFGFHLQYNRIFYIVHHIESNSPAERSGLRVNDVILKVNNQATDQMPHQAFVQIMNTSTEVRFLVQTHDHYKRTHPQVSRPKTTKPKMETTVPNNRKDNDRYKNVLSRALTKLTSR